MIDKIPLFTKSSGNNFELTDGVFVTEKHIKSSIIKLFPGLCEEYLMRKLWKNDSVIKIYAWNSIIDTLNKNGTAWIVLNDLLKD
jgi:hypothetical protein